MSFVTITADFKIKAYLLKEKKPSCNKAMHPIRRQEHLGAYLLEGPGFNCCWPLELAG